MINVFLLTLFLTLFWPLSLEPKQLFVKMSFGVFSGGSVEDVKISNTGYYDTRTIAGEKSRPGMDVTVEFIY